MRRHDPDAKLREKVEKKLRGPISAGIWAELESERRDALDGGPDDFAALVEKARTYRRIARSLAGKKPIPGRPRLSPAEALLPRIDNITARVVGSYISRQAKQLGEVRHFRDAYLNGGILTAEDAERFADSPLLRRLPGKLLLLEGIGASEHRITSLDLVERRGRIAEVRVRGVCGRKSFNVGFDAVAYYAIVDSSDQLEVRLPPHGKRVMSVASGSVLAELARTGTALVRRFRWSASDATWFVLTDQAPALPAANMRYEVGYLGAERFARLTVSAQPWVTAESMRRIYEQLRRGLIARGDHTLTIKALRVFTFVERQRMQGRLPSWAVLLRRWNHAHAKHRFSDRAALHKAYRRARESLLLPLLDRSKSKTSA